MIIAGDVVPAVIVALEIVMVVAVSVLADVLPDARDVMVTVPVILVPPLVTCSVIQVLAQ